MTTRHTRPAIVTALALMLGMIFAQAAAAQNYKIDPAHTSVVFHIRHAGISNVAGMFTETEGNFTIGNEPSETSFHAEVKVDSVFTGQKLRDTHLKGDTFFNAKQFPLISFKSTTVAANPDGYDVTGDLTLHGVTKPITLKLVRGGKADFPPGTHRAGFTGDLEIKRSDFNMKNMIGPVGDDVKLVISFEGVQQ